MTHMSDSHNGPGPILAGDQFISPDLASWKVCSAKYGRPCHDPPMPLPPGRLPSAMLEAGNTTPRVGKARIGNEHLGSTNLGE